MNLFDDIIIRLRGFLDEKRSSGELRTLQVPARADWPAGERGNIVFAEDTAVELGDPRDASASFMVWTEQPGAVADGVVTLVGPDIPEARGKRLPFGKAVILGVRGMTADNCYERHRALEMMRFDLNLRGYMMRAVSQYLREWSRVSRTALEGGFAFTTIAGALAGMYRKADFVESVEFLFVTSSTADVRNLGDAGGRAERLIGAMNKMSQEMSFDCGNCDYNDVCAEVEDLRNMRKTMGEGDAGATGR